MNTEQDLAPRMGGAPAAPCLDAATEQIRNGYVAGVTLRTMVNPDAPIEVLISNKLATRIGQLLLEYVQQQQRQQAKEQVQAAKQAQRPAPVLNVYRPARRVPKEAPTGVIQFEFTLDTDETLHDWLHPLKGCFYLHGVRQELATGIYLPSGYWRDSEQCVRKPLAREKCHLAFTEERIKRANAGLATLQSRVKVAYLSLPEDQRTAENVHRWLSGKTVPATSPTPASTYQRVA